MTNRRRLAVAAALVAIIGGAAVPALVTLRHRPQPSPSTTRAATTPAAPNSEIQPPLARAVTGSKSKPAAAPNIPRPRAVDAPVAPAPPVHPPFVFDAKAVVAEDGRNREHDTTVLLADGALTITEKNDRVVAAVPFSSVVAINISNSRQPMWNSPSGPAELLKVEAGRLGFLKGDRSWLGVRTPRTAVVLRVDDDELPRVVAALEARTGQKAERIDGRR